MNKRREIVMDGLHALACMMEARAKLTKSDRIYQESVGNAAAALALREDIARRGLAALHQKEEVKHIPATNGIATFFHCSRCIDEKPNGQSPQEWARLSIGFTKEGLQVWCVRHDMNVAHVHFEGQQHPALLHAKKPARRPAASKKDEDRVLIELGGKFLDSFGGGKDFEWTGDRRGAWSMRRADAEQRLKAWKLKGTTLVKAGGK